MGRERQVYLNPTDSKLEEVLAGRDDELNPVKGDNDAASTTSDDSTKQDTSSTDTGDDSSSSSDDSADEGYTANDYGEEEEPSKPEEKTETPKTLDPELQYIVDNLPLVSVRIKDGDSVKDVQIKSWTQLPQDVEFASKRDELAFQNAMVAQENLAQQLRNNYRLDQHKSQLQQFESRENAAIRDDISELQEANLLPKFKVNPNESGFEDDPATKEVQKVLDFMNKRNAEYLERYNSGSAYRHIGFAEAYYMMPETQQKTAQRVAQKQEDTERKRVADKVGGNTGTASMKRPTVPRGTSLDEIVDRIEQEWS